MTPSLLRTWEVASAIGMALSGEVSVDVLEVVLEDRSAAEDANWSMQTARADAEAKATIWK